MKNSTHAISNFKKLLGTLINHRLLCNDSFAQWTELENDLGCMCKRYLVNVLKSTDIEMSQTWKRDEENCLLVNPGYFPLDVY